MHGILGWLLSTEMGPPGPAGRWPTWLGVAFHASNLVMALGFGAVPLIIVHEWKYRRDGIDPRKFWMVLAFLPFTAISRLARVLEMGGAPYHLTTILDALNAVAVVASVSVLRPKIRHVLKLPGRDELHDAWNRAATEAVRADVLRVEADVRRRDAEQKAAILVDELDRVRAKLLDRRWYAEKNAILDDLGRIDALLRSPDDPRDH